MAEDRDRDRAHPPRAETRERGPSTEPDAPGQSSASDWNRGKPRDITPSDQADGAGDREAQQPDHSEKNPS
jgi:hypothetical protein